MSLVQLFDIVHFEKVGFQKVWYETGFFEKTKCSIKAVIKCFLKN